MTAGGRARGLAAVLGAAAVGLGGAAGPVVVDPPAVPVGGLAVVRVAASRASGSFEGKRLAFFPAGDHAVALLGVDLDHPPGAFRLEITGLGAAPVVRSVEVLARRFPEERLTVPRTYTELDPATLRRVVREQKLLESLWPKSAARRLWRGDFLFPASGPEGSPFGLRRFFNGEPRSPHAGLDIRAPAGTPVRASNRGRVVLARELFFTGNSVILDHGLGLFTLYVHLSAMAVRRGAVVDKGEEIGKVGATGRATGPHLHFAVRIGQARIDPAALVGRALE